MGRVSSSSAGVVASAASCSAVRAPRRCPDCEEMTTPAPPRAITFPNSSSSTAVPYRSTARIAAGDAWLGETPAAWMTPVTSPSPVAVSTSACSDSQGHIHGGGADLESGVAQHLGRRVGVPLAQVRQQDLLTGADPPGDCLTDRPGSDDDRDLAHGDLLGRSCGCIARPSSGRWAYVR